MLSAEYADRKACPHCGKPARKLGRWYIAQGEWRFSAVPVSVSKPKSFAPEEEGGLWHLFKRVVEVTDPRTGIMKAKQVEEYERLAHYECIGGRHDAGESCGIFHLSQVRPYRGEEHDWMAPPSPPEKRDVDALIAGTRGKMEAANDA